MSGPKLSQAELERRRQAELERQRLEYLARLAELQKQKDELCDWLNGDAFRRMERTSVTAAQNLRKELEDSLSQFSDVPAPDMQSLSSYMERLGKVQKRNQEGLQRVREKIRQEELRQAALGQRQEGIAAEQKISQIVQGVRQDAPVFAAVVGFDFDGDVRQLRVGLAELAKNLSGASPPGNQKLSALVRGGSAKLMAYAKAPDLQYKKEEARQYTETLLNEWQEKLRQLREWRERYREYCALAQATRISPRPSEDFADEKAIQDEIRRLSEIYRRKDEMDYIATQINEAMISLGYRFVTSTVLQRGDGSEYDYSLYQADEQAGVSIYTDESGAVMMRLTTFGEGAVTPLEEEESYQRQLDFCAAHPDIVEELARRGVLLKQVNYAPPSKKYVMKRKTVQGGTAKVIDRRRRRREKQKMRSMRSS